MDEDDKVTLDPNILKRVQYRRSSLKCYFFDWISLELYWCKYYPKPIHSRKEDNNSIPRLLVHQGVDAFQLIHFIPITSSAYVARLWLWLWLWLSSSVREKDPEGERRLKADVWLLGITALELAYGGLRITSRRELESIHVSGQKRVFSKGFMDLVVSCPDFRPEKRPTSAQLLCHHAFKRVQSWHVLPEGLFPDDEFY
ncbi:hypothetical protein SASPL_125368 [Salvia splendens]|uniref:Protein kinase domain-containing protein n=1 Tax=Salvia splendens TaxID=180675 RepID=A0A8X8XGZ6_SALSN|nr:hypothetical protein SASPL_125368 [Salvia splendens]